MEDCPELTISLEDGTGPRHMEFNCKADMLYCISELGGKVYALKISSENGRPAFTLQQSLKADLSLLPAALEAALQGRQLQPMLRMF